MWSRQLLKNQAKTTLQTCYGNSVLICLVTFLLMNFANLFSRKYSITFNVNTGDLYFVKQYSLLSWIPFSFLIPILIQIFIIHLLSVGSAYFFLSSRIRASSIHFLGFPFKKGRYGNVCKVMFLTKLFIALWSLLFLIPGIYKTYQYRMVPYLLAENPDLDYDRVLSMSKMMMNGEKWNAFILDLSFIGWEILSIFTCLILAIAYVSPYIAHTKAGLYILLREKAINNGLINPAELYAVVNDIH